ncbi:MAG: carotenoid 1,2-hydratase [Chromatiales bacterium]|nr:carotenoid 1,2-hydratase [Chromatiales bacterium]
MLSRRQVLLAIGALAAPASQSAVSFPDVVPRPLGFPDDFGAHPDFRTEWWYLTGWLGGTSRPMGFQVTFFRVRTDVDPDNPSAFAARQLVIAHAALADPARGRLLLDERIARTGFDLVQAATGDTDVRLDGWSLARDPATDSYRARIAARDFTLNFTAVGQAPPWLQGDGGLSSKGPLPTQASYYYTRPQLRVEAEIRVAAVAAPARGNGDRRDLLEGVAWLDHEWSSAALAPDAAGWDWIGMNLDDGGALLAFQIRRQGAKPDEPPLQRYAAFRGPDGSTSVVDPATVSFTPLRHWQSARSRATWPVAQRIAVGDRIFETAPLMPDQELDSRMTTGAVYWEGASTLLEGGRPVGRGYLEMTGYVTPLRL